MCAVLVRKQKNSQKLEPKYAMRHFTEQRLLQLWEVFWMLCAIIVLVVIISGYY